MGRKRQGSVRLRAGSWYVGFRLKQDDPFGSGRGWEQRVPAPADGSEPDETYARLCLAKALHAYESGTWNPYRPKEQAPAAEAPKTVRAYAIEWIKRQTYESAPKDRARLEIYLDRATLGSMALADVTPQHIAAFVEWLKAQPSNRGGTLAARTVRNIYDAVRRAFAFAKFQCLIKVTPCEMPVGILPAIEDKDEMARDGWEFSHAEIVSLLWDHRVPEARRVYYALGMLTGMRPGEVVVLRWRDWDRTVLPLTRLTVVRARKSVSGREGRTKTGAKKVVPVHPALAEILTAWLAEGWKRLVGREPVTDEFVIPNRRGARRDIGRANRDLGRDLAKLEMNKRHQYVMRHTFITRAQDDGADGQVLRWVTHAPPKSAFDGYTRTQWSRLCAELAKLRVNRPEIESRQIDRQDGGGTESTAVFPREKESGREDLNLQDFQPSPTITHVNDRSEG